MLEDQRQLNEEMRTALVRNIQRASLDLEQRVNELFELARGELGLLEIKPEKVDMNQLIQEISTETGPTAAKKGIKIVFQASEMPCEVWGDKNRLRQVLSNLLGNALRYTDQGQITIRCLHHGEDLLLTQIEDSGRGIEKDVLDNLFDPYLRSTKEKSRSTGLGIGLALSKKYVELHKGEIWAESIAGKGTTISFVIPLFKAVNENKPS
jgi:signal transduction histidine kinase